MERLEDENLELKQKIRKLAQHSGQRYMLVVGSLINDLAFILTLVIFYVLLVKALNYNIPYHARYFMYYTPPQIFLQASSYSHVFTCQAENSILPDQLASQKAADLYLHYFQNRIYPGLSLSSLKTAEDAAYLWQSLRNTITRKRSKSAQYGSASSDVLE